MKKFKNQLSEKEVVLLLDACNHYQKSLRQERFESSREARRVKIVEMLEGLAIAGAKLSSMLACGKHFELLFFDDVYNHDIK